MEIIAMMKLRLANEYLAGPIFCPEPERVGHIYIDDLPISQELKGKIGEWDGAYQATFNNDYPPDSGFSSPDMKFRYVEAWRRLAQKLQQELDGSYVAEYCP